jgi:hypothetical protein
LSERVLLTQMETSKEILTELQEIAPNLGITGISRAPYAAPVGFFEEFPENLMNRIRMEAALYLEFNAGQQNAEVSSLLEIEEISPLLAGLKNKNTYQVPAGYFESLKTKIPALESKPFLPKKKQAPVFTLKFIKYTVAACLVALLGTAVFNLTYHKTTDPIKDLATVSDQDMANYLDSDDIHWTPGITASSASIDISDNDVHDLLSTVSDDELEQYSASLSEEKRNVN